MMSEVLFFEVREIAQKMIGLGYRLHHIREDSTRHSTNAYDYKLCTATQDDSERSFILQSLHT